MAVLCYSQLVTSAHFVEHLPQHSHAEHRDSFSGTFTLEHARKHSSEHVSHNRESFHHAGKRISATDHGEGSNPDCSIYHVFSQLNGVIQARTSSSGTVFNLVKSATRQEAYFKRIASHHQAIRAPPLFS